MTGKGTGERCSVGDEALRTVAAGRWAGKGLREIAVEQFGAARIDAEWTPNGPMRAKVRLLVQRARASSGGGPGGAGPGTP